ncbi:Protein CCC1 [Lachancea thermotolerans]|uniref:KLTH0E10164p n=1 Tax=Lachancea thermotolerans (strain ATCC 56472 / CBS 6340 / NRRL Y-8284) TaxID=559295 RepID=C5DI70_LACTC|nr:KLTH0E10164p [Lachancea thermotolerans CBS 6340]CAR23481.1 KLTH0E10164p [Lachancea thermotolerans CBS 6340]
MSIVAIKNAVVNLVSKKSENAPLLSNDDNADTSYGSSSNTDEERGKLEDKREERKGGIFGSVDPRLMSDLIIGLSDGLTVPFALTAGLSSLGDSKLVITGGFAELISGAISMGLGGYLGAKSESDYFHAEVKKEKRKFYNNMNLINHEIEDILLEINPEFSDETIISFIKDLQKSPELMVDFIIRYGRGLEEPADNRQTTSALTIGGGYFAGGFVPLIPYFFVKEVGSGLIISIILMSITLFWFGYIKAAISMSDSCTVRKKIGEGFQMMAVGGIAAGAAWFMVRVIDN